MKSFSFVLLCFVVLTSGSAFPQSDSSMIVKTILNYGNAIYSLNPDMMESALRPEAVETTPTKVGVEGMTILNYSTCTSLIARCGLKFSLLEESKRKIKVTFIAKTGDIACAKIESAKFNNYFILVKSGDAWKILNIMSSFGLDLAWPWSTDSIPADKLNESVKGTVKGFYESVYKGDLPLLEKTLHNECNILQFSMSRDNGKTVIGKTGYGQFHEVVRQKLLLTDTDNINVTVNVLDVMHDMAVAEVVSANSVNLIQAACLDGEWKLVNMLSMQLPRE